MLFNRPAVGTWMRKGVGSAWVALKIALVGASRGGEWAASVNHQGAGFVKKPVLT